MNLIYKQLHITTIKIKAYVYSTYKLLPMLISHYQVPYTYLYNKNNIIINIIQRGFVSKC